MSLTVWEPARVEQVSSSVRGLVLDEAAFSFPIPLPSSGWSRVRLGMDCCLKSLELLSTYPGRAFNYFDLWFASQPAHSFQVLTRQETVYSENSVLAGRFFVSLPAAANFGVALMGAYTNPRSAATRAKNYAGPVSSATWTIYPPASPHSVVLVDITRSGANDIRVGAAHNSTAISGVWSASCVLQRLLHSNTPETALSAWLGGTLASPTPAIAHNEAAFGSFTHLVLSFGHPVWRFVVRSLGAALLA